MEEKTTIVIPTYNERENIVGLIASIKKWYPHVTIFIVDDNSPDGTGMVADALAESHTGVSVLHRSLKSGIGIAYRDAFRKILNNEDVLYVITMDADFSHDPEDLKKLFASVRENDIVVGSRYVPGGKVENWSRWRRVLSRYGNLYTRVILGARIHDMTAGFVLYRREFLERIMQKEISSNGYAFQMEMKYAAHTLGGRMQEVPITFRERRNGTSKLDKEVIWEGLLLPLRIRFTKI